MKWVAPMLVGVFTGCGTAPYPAYWPESDDLPAIDSVSPDTLTDSAGGQLITLKGAGLETAKTVLIGDRNATILETSAIEVVVEMPQRLGGDSSLDVAVVTDHGFSRLGEALRIERPGHQTWPDEIASIAVVKTECPIEAWAFWGDDYYPLMWCGFEGGYAYASGVISTQAQAGFAGDLSGYTPLSLVPAPERFSLWHVDSLQIPKLPDRYATHQPGDEFRLVAPRDFQRDLHAIDDHLQRIADYYYWYDDVTAAYPTVAVLDEESCWLANAELLESETRSITLSEEFDGVAGVWLGFGVEEDYDGETYYEEGFLATAFVTPEGAKLTGSPTGVSVQYDDYSGTFNGAGVGGLIGNADIPPDTAYEVIHTTGDSENLLGSIDGPEALLVTEPDLISGLSQIIQTEDLTITWVPFTEDLGQVVVAVEIIVYDYDIDHPNGSQEIARLVTSAHGESGTLTIPATELAALPLAANALSDEDEFIGFWGELNLVAHQLRSVNYRDNSLVVDFVHAISTPIDIVSP